MAIVLPSTFWTGVLKETLYTDKDESGERTIEGGEALGKCLPSTGEPVIGWPEQTFFTATFFVNVQECETATCCCECLS